MAKTAKRGARSWKRILLWVIGIAVVLFIVIQFVPYGRSSHSNPTATNPFKWTDPQAEAIAKTSCYDCHSNETKWWWATNIAPFSWLVQSDVDGGRARLNFSEFDGLPPAEELQGVVQEGEMPPFQYTIIHPGAKLTDAQKQTLIKGYAAGLAASGASSGGQPEPQSSATPTSTPTPTASSTSSSADAVATINDALRPVPPGGPGAELPGGEHGRGAGAHRRHDPARRAGDARAAADARPVLHALTHDDEGGAAATAAPPSSRTQAAAERRARSVRRRAPRAGPSGPAPARAARTPAPARPWRSSPSR